MNADLGPEARFIAGGTDLMLEWQREVVSFSHCIDLSQVAELCTFSHDSDRIRMGTMTRLGRLASLRDAGWLPRVLASTASLMCTPQLRNLATVGGNLCHASPAADMAVLLTALDASIEARSVDGSRSVPLPDFFVGVNTTSLRQEELAEAVTVPLPEAPTEAAYMRVGRTSIDLAQASAAVRLSCDADGVVVDARVVIGACATTPVRSGSAEEVLTGLDVRRPDVVAVDEAAARAESCTCPISDVRCSREYRREASRVLLRRAVSRSAAALADRLDEAEVVSAAGGER
jgi:carbon-monoxide dehydrogenase medium subunit